LLRHKLPTNAKRLQRGFTLVELLIVMILVVLISGTFYTFFKTNLFTYLNLQKDASGFTDLASQSQRIGNVLRGSTDVVSVADDDLVLYGYFYPTDTYVSLIHYYRNAADTVLYVDVTPMTANPPIGTPIIANKKTFTIIPAFKAVSGVKLFQYLDSAGAVLGLPITDLHTIKGMQVNLAVPTAIGGGNQSMTLQVSLRNRKTNL
jgi:prepilin-type N-terminal cleavage/methylation domain-containing protein